MSNEIDNKAIISAKFILSKLQVANLIDNNKSDIALDMIMQGLSEAHEATKDINTTKRELYNIMMEHKKQGNTEMYQSVYDIYQEIKDSTKKAGL
jgi:hypothetical protein